jgi:hypothetical protein
VRITGLALLALTLALAGCGTSGGSYSSSSSSDEEDAAGMLLMGGTAFVNGWNATRYYQRPVVTCYGGGSVTQCY